jgi:primosomal protein N' (replication factor Y)
MTASVRYVDVALPLPIPEPYTYSVPETLADRVTPGARVVVPVRNREVIGVVVKIDVAAPEGEVEAKSILATPDVEPALTPELLETATWMAGYYGAPIGLALKAVLPGGMWGKSRVMLRALDSAKVPGGFGADLLRWLEGKGGEASISAASKKFRKPVWDAADRLARVGAAELLVEPAKTGVRPLTERVLVLEREQPTLVERQTLFKGRPRQRQLYEALEELGGSAPIPHLKERLGFSDSVIKALGGHGLSRVDRVETLRDPFAGHPGVPPPPEPSAAQVDAIEKLEALSPGEGALLFGVTGSGKTLVYLEVIRRALERGRGAIVLVPEIGLTPQTVSRVRGIFGDKVAVLHSGLSEGERADAWRALRRGERMVAVGARSAVFAPVKDLGVIVIDEEHEATYKNGETPRYDARQVATVRARLEGARLIYGSATPSLDTAARLDQDLIRLSLPDRVGMRPMPEVKLVDLKHEPLVKEARPIPWSEELDWAVVETLARGEQAMLLLNRRGFASFLICPECGEVWMCGRCSISLTVHTAPSTLRCHYCGREEPLPSECPQCSHAIHHMRGIGTQQLERMVTERFPKARLARMDLDTTSTKWSHHKILGAVERGEVDILLGTQMIAKGLDFPNVTLVGVVDADTALYLPDFRSAERTFQLLAQVAGRTGRGPKGGRVLVQTRQPDHHALRYTVDHDVEGFLAEEMETRNSPPYPPMVTLANVLVSGTSDVAVGREAARVADWSDALVEQQGLEITVLGPAPAPLAKIKDRWRWHVVWKGEGQAIGRVVRYAAERLTGKGGVRVVIDRDPASLL